MPHFFLFERFGLHRPGCFRFDRLQEHRPGDGAARSFRLQRLDFRFVETADVVEHRQNAVFRPADFRGRGPNRCGLFFGNQLKRGRKHFLGWGDTGQLRDDWRRNQVHRSAHSHLHPIDREQIRASADDAAASGVNILYHPIRPPRRWDMLSRGRRHERPEESERLHFRNFAR